MEDRSGMLRWQGSGMAKDCKHWGPEKPFWGAEVVKWGFVGVNLESMLQILGRGAGLVLG